MFNEKKLKNAVFSYFYTKTSTNIKRFESAKQNLEEILQQEGAFDCLVNQISDFHFYMVVQDLNLPKRLIKQRQSLQKSVLNNYENYPFEMIVESLCGLLFRNSPHNSYNHILTLEESAKYMPKVKKEYKRYEKLFNLIKQFIEAVDFGSDELNKKFKEISRELKMLNKKPEEISEAVFNLLKIANEESREELKKSTSDAKKITSNLKPEDVVSKDGKQVKFYKIKNQTENQRDFQLLVRTCSIMDYMFDGDATEQWKAFASKKRGWSFSVVDATKLRLFSKDNRVCFGFFDIGEASIISSTFRDGQTGQYAMSLGQTMFRQEFTPMKVLLEKTAVDSYNEIQLFNPEQVVPTVVICQAEQPTDEEIRIAAAFNIPLIFIDKYCYPEAVCTREKETPKENAKLKYKYPESLTFSLSKVAGNNITT